MFTRPIRQAQAGRLGGDAEGAGQGHLQAAAGGEAVDGGDAGLGHTLQLPGEDPSAPGSLPHLRQDIAGLELLDVGASDEGLLAGTGEDEHPGRVVGLELSDGVQGLVDGGVAEGVADLGAVEGEDGQAILPLVADVLIGHAQAPC